MNNISYEPVEDGQTDREKQLSPHTKSSAQSIKPVSSNDTTCTGLSRRRTLLQGSTETLLQYTMRPSIIHPNQCIYDVKTGSEFLTYSKNCASQRQTDFTINRLNSNKKSVKGLGTPRGGQGGQNPPKLLGLAGEKFLKINKIFKLGIPGRICQQVAQL